MGIFRSERPNNLGSVRSRRHCHPLLLFPTVNSIACLPGKAFTQRVKPPRGQIARPRLEKTTNHLTRFTKPGMFLGVLSQPEPQGEVIQISK